MDCADETYSLADVFPMDSLIRKKMVDNKINSELHIGFYNTRTNQYAYLSDGADSTSLEVHQFEFPVSENEIIRLSFPEKRKTLIKSILGTIISSLVLVLVAIVCYVIVTRMLLRQKKLTEMKNDFINNVTHEFKTPIATINLALANIENEQALTQPTIIKQFTKVIRDENLRLNTQVEKVLEARLIDDKDLSLKLEKVDMHQIIDQLSQAYALKIAKNGTFSKHLEATSFVVKGDAFHLSNTVSNLLDNAIKYSSEPRHITISTSNTGQSLQIAVKDNGLGIATEDQNSFLKSSSGCLPETYIPPKVLA